MFSIFFRKYVSLNYHFSNLHNSPLMCMELYVHQVASKPNSCSKTNRLRRRMISNSILNKRNLLNTPSPFNGDTFELWKSRFKIFIKSISFELWETILNILFIPTHHMNGKVVDKQDFLWTIEEKRKFEIDFKNKKNNLSYVFWW